MDPENAIIADPMVPGSPGLLPPLPSQYELENTTVEQPDYGVFDELPPLPDSYQQFQSLVPPPVEWMFPQPEVPPPPPPPAQLAQRITPPELLAPEFESPVQPVPGPTPLTSAEQPALTPELPPPAPIEGPALPTPTEQYEAKSLGAARELDQIAADREALKRTRAEIQQKYASTTDQEERAQLQQQFADIEAQEGRLAQRRQEVQGDLETSAVQLQASVQADQAQLIRAGQDEITKRRRQLEDDSKRREQARQAEIEKTQTRLSEDRKAYREFIENPPKQGWDFNIAQALTSIFVESVTADRERRGPNFGPALDRLSKARQGKISEIAKAKLDAIGLTGDDLTDLRRLADEEKAQDAAANVEVLTRLEQDIQLRVEQATTPLSKLQNASALESVRVERERAEMAAYAAREEADRRREKEDAELRLKNAQIRKAEAEAAKLERRGRGGGKKPIDPGLIPANVVPLPGAPTGAPGQITFPDTPDGRKEAANTRKVVALQADFVATLNELEALANDAEKEGWAEGLPLSEQSNQALRAKAGVAQNLLAQMKAGPGLAASEGDNKWATDYLGLDENGNIGKWTDADSVRKMITAVRGEGEGIMRTNLQAYTRLTDDSIESVVKYGKGKGVGKKQAAEEAAKKAPETITAPESTPAQRVNAADAIEETERKAGGDWRWRAAPKLIAGLDAATDAASADAIQERLDSYKKVLEEGRGPLQMAIDTAPIGSGVRNDALAQRERYDKRIQEIDAAKQRRFAREFKVVGGGIQKVYNQYFNPGEE